MDKTVSSHGLRNVIRGFMLLVLVILVGTAGYMSIEGWHALEALYMTVITSGCRRAAFLKKGISEFQCQRHSARIKHRYIVQVCLDKGRYSLSLL